MSCTRIHEPISKLKPALYLSPKVSRVISNKKLSKFVQVCCPHCQAAFMYDDPWLHTKEAADIVGFEPDTLVTWRSHEKYDIPFVRIGRAVRYPLSDLIRYKARKRKEMEFQLMP